MTDDTDLRSKLAECESIIQQLVARLQETVDENDRLRAMTEGASSYATLSEIHRNRDLSAAVRTKAAIGCLSREIPPLAPERAPLELTAAKPADLPLAEVVRLQRARADVLSGLPPGHPEYEQWTWREDYTCPALDSPGQGGDDGRDQS